MSKDEVLELALEVLVSSTGELHRHLASPNDYQLVKNHRAIAAIKAALEAKDEPVGDNKVKQLVNQCTHRDIDGNWYVDGVQLVHATCDAIIKGTI